MTVIKSIIKKFKNEEYANKPIQSNKINIFFRICEANSFSPMGEKLKIVKDDKKDMKKISYFFDADICLKCGGEMIQDDEGMICNHCFIMKPYLIQTNSTNNIKYNEIYEELSFHVIYIRISHFKEILHQYQGIENFKLSDEILQKIKNQIIKERLHENELTYSKIKNILKNLSYQKLYEHIHLIKRHLGLKVVFFGYDMEEKLIYLFKLTEWAFSKIQKDRCNFFNYYFILDKLLKLIHRTDLIHDIPTLKDKHKMNMQEDLWKEICEMNHWEIV
jgi:hypothetical protein